MGKIYITINQLIISIVLFGGNTFFIILLLSTGAIFKFWSFKLLNSFIILCKLNISFIMFSMWYIFILRQQRWKWNELSINGRRGR